MKGKTKSGSSQLKGQLAGGLTRLKSWAEPLTSRVPSHVKETFRLQTFALTKIPLLLFIGPRVLEASDERMVIKIPLTRRTQNHVGSMYFAVMSAGADVACGLLAVRLIEKLASGHVSLIFKDFKADFLKRAEADVLFTCEQGPEIQSLINKVVETKGRQNLPVLVTATVPSLFGKDPIAQFTLTLSLKYQ